MISASLTADGVGAACQIPDAIHSERTFAYSGGEVDYVHHMASYFSDPDRSGPRRFILSGVSGLYVSPLPYAYSKVRAALQKSACFLMHLHGVALAPHDWAVHRRSDEEDGRVLRASSFEKGLSIREFPPLPVILIEGLPSQGVHSLLPFILKHFGFLCTDSRHPVCADVIYNLEREWAWSLGNALMNEVSVQERLYVQPPEVLQCSWRVAADLPAFPYTPSNGAMRTYPGRVRRY